MTEITQYTVAEGVATIRLDDGKANAMSVTMIAAINAALTRAESDKAIVVIEGRPGMFSAGFDLGAFKRDPQELLTMLKTGAQLAERVLSFPYPVLVHCSGHAIAMGAFLLLSADVRVGSMASAKIQANEVQIGLTLPQFAIEICRQRLHPAHFNLAGITSQPYDQLQAVSAGFLDEVVAPELLEATLKKRVDHLRSLNMPAFAATKLRLRKNSLEALRAAIDADCDDWEKRFHPQG